MIKTTIKNGGAIQAKEHKGAVGAISTAKEALQHSIENNQRIEIRIIHTPNLKRSKDRRIKGIVILR